MSVYEDWVPPDSRILDRLKANTGETSADAFVYFPKVTVGGYACIEIPAGTQLYKGIDRPCAAIADPGNAPTWFADKQSASRYAEKVYAFETTAPIVLLNLLDDRNIEKLIEFAKELMRDAKRAMNKFDLSKQASWLPDQWARFRNAENAFYDTRDQIERLKTATGYGPARPTDPALNENVRAEFGNLDQLSRYSFSVYDTQLAADLQELLALWRPIQGYYAPSVPGLHRELCVFRPQGLVRFRRDRSPGCVRGGKTRRRQITQKRTTKRTRRVR